MALQLSLSSSPIRSSPSTSCSSTHTIISRFSTGDRLSPVALNVNSSRVNRREKRRFFSVRSTLETAVAVVGQVTEVDKDTFWPIVSSAGDKIVVLDMYTQWCGPCKVMAPKYQELSEKYLDVVFLKIDCGQANKPLAKELGIKVVPTFKILKHGKIVKEVTGAKMDNLILAIDNVRSS